MSASVMPNAEAHGTSEALKCIPSVSLSPGVCSSVVLRS